MGSYDDIIHLPHHVSPTRPRMSAHDRAAQFSPFAALTGYEAVIEQAGESHLQAAFLMDNGGVGCADDEN